MPDSKEKGPAEILRVVLADALRQVSEDVAHVTQHVFLKPGERGRIIGGLWIAALRDAFEAEVCKHGKNLHAIGGRPRPKGPPLPDRSPKSRKSCLGKWEFVHDISVVEVDTEKAPYKKFKVPYVKKALWALESEMAASGKEVAFDLSKLRITQADNKVLIVRSTGQLERQNWENFINSILPADHQSTFVGFMPSYSDKGWTVKRPNPWHHKLATIDLFQLVNDGSTSRLISLGQPISSSKIAQVIAA